MRIIIGDAFHGSRMNVEGIIKKVDRELNKRIIGGEFFQVEDIPVPVDYQRHREVLTDYIMQTQALYSSEYIDPTIAIQYNRYTFAASWGAIAGTAIGALADNNAWLLGFGLGVVIATATEAVLSPVSRIFHSYLTEEQPYGEQRNAYRAALRAKLS